MNIELFLQRAEALHNQLADLYQTAQVLAWIPPDLLPQATQELYSNSKTVQLAAKELYQQNADLLRSKHQLTAERLHYYDLFEFAPDAYVVTDSESIIQEVNQAAAQLFKSNKQTLFGQSISKFLGIEERESLRLTISQLSDLSINQELVLRFQPNHGEYFDAAVTINVIRNQKHQPTGLRWLVRPILQYQHQKLSDINQEDILSQGRPSYTYVKGENIPLNPLIIFYICQGYVKLTTYDETGNELLLGLVTPKMIFSSSMTSLSIYQATALSDVKILSIYVNELTSQPSISHILLPKIKQRLQQTESLVVTFGKRRVEDRLQYFLHYLKQQIGESVTAGTRLNIRFTHEEIANACSTTRVTVTRLISKLQRQGLITFDAEKYMILTD